MESFKNQADEHLRSKMQNGRTTQPRVMSGVEETKKALLTYLEKLRRFAFLKEERKEAKAEVEHAAEQIKAETQELQQNTDSHSDPQVRHTAEFVQKMSEEILEQKERLSDIKAPVKETCREAKIVLQQITALSVDKLQSLSEETKLKLESTMKNFWKLTASMWKLIFCVLLLYELRDVFASLKSETHNISLSRGRLKYAFKMASMMALWLAHDVESNPGPQFKTRDCIEKLVRELSEVLRHNLRISGSIWSEEVANAAYNVGFSVDCRWKNPSGKNKDSLQELIQRGMELGRLLTDRNCLPTDLAPFTVDLDQEQTQDRLRQHLKAENYRAAVDALLSERDFNPSTTHTIRDLTQSVQEKISPSATTTNSEFSQLADSQSIPSTVCEPNTSILNIVTRYQSKRRQGKKNKNTKTKQLIDVVASESYTATGRPYDDMFTSEIMEEGTNADSSPGSHTNGRCMLSTSRPDTPQQDEFSREADTPGTDSSHTSAAEHVMMSDVYSFDETDIHNNSGVPSQEGQRNVDLVPPSDSNSCEVNGGDEVPGDILSHIKPTSDTPDDIFKAHIESALFDFMQGGDVNTQLTDTDNGMNDVPPPRHTSDVAPLASLEFDLFSVMKGNDVDTSSTDASNPDYTPDDEAQQDAAAAHDIGCEDEIANTSEPSQEEGASIDNKQLDQPNTATDRCQDDNVSRKERTERHETQLHSGLGANRRDTQICVTTAGTSTQVFELKLQGGERKSAEENEYITKSEQAILFRHYVASEQYTIINIESEAPSQAEMGNVDLVPSSDSNSCEVTDGFDDTYDMLDHNLPSEITEDTLLAQMKSSIQTDDVIISSSNTSNVDYLPNIEVKDAPAAGDDGCEGDTIMTPSEPLQRQQGSEVVTRMTKPPQNTTPLIDTRACETTTDADTQACEETEADKQTCERDALALEAMAEAGTQACEPIETDKHACETMAVSDAHARESMTETDNHACLTTETTTQAYEDTDRKSTEGKEYITKSEFDVRLKNIERTLQEVISLIGTGQTSRSHEDNTLNQEPDDKPETSAGSSSDRRLTGNRKRKHPLQHLTTKKIRQ